MNIPIFFRENGAIGALLDEYERALRDLKTIVAHVSDGELTNIVDSATQDPDCHSVQTILSHVVRSGYGYAIYIRNQQGEKMPFHTSKQLKNSAAYIAALDGMFDFNVKVFEDYPNLVLESHHAPQKILVSWGQLYDIEQLLEHAIVHVLRHRRQIERFLQQMR
ncbi:MAG: hypothetical protein RL757_1726 [Bacteroidota bacterium]|jgi:uncharacterized damage-inducible protein DinB